MTGSFSLGQPEPKRDGWGRYLLPDVDSGGGPLKPRTRATTFAKSISDTYGLQKWATRMAVKGVTMRPDLLALAASAPITDSKTLDQVAEDAKETAGASAGRNAGTALHAFTEQVDRGENVTIPPPWDADVLAYQTAMRDAGVTVLSQFIERIVIVKRFNVAGTLDRLVRWIELPDGTLVVADLKTAKDLSYSWLEIAIQLALYAHADALWDGITGRYEPMPKLDLKRGIVMHSPAGKATCQLYEVDIAAGWEVAQLCADVRAWRSKKGLGKKLGPIVAASNRTQIGTSEPVDLAREISEAATITQLFDLWKLAQAAGHWTPVHTALASARRAQLEASPAA